MRQGLLYIWMLIVFNSNGLVTGTGVCVSTFPETASVGEVIINDITQYCEYQGASVTLQTQNGLFQLNGTQLMVDASLRLENTKSHVGKGSCHGTELINRTQKLNFLCSGGFGQGSVSCDIFITPVDNYEPFFCNENCFNITSITVSLNESLPIGSDFYRGKVCDNDACGDNCFDSRMEVNNTLIGFRTDSAGGDFTLSLNGSLDYESSTTHSTELMIVTSLQGTVSIPVVIHVLDEDDQSPMFTEELYVFNITERNFTSNQMTQYKVTAVDQDRAIDAPLNYRVTSDFPSDVTFNVSKDGTIMVYGNLDRERTPYYSLEIMAYQEGREKDRFNFTTVVINVMDVDDNPPQFTVRSADVEVVENLNNGVVIYTPSVTDIDKGENAAFNFSIDDNTVFDINETTGAVSVKDSSALDREKQQQFTLQLTAQSTKTPSNKDTMLLHITLKDINDNTPKFDHKSYQKTIRKDFSTQREVLKVTATDADMGQNAQLKYSLEPASTLFSIDSISGSITLNTTLRETLVKHYKFFVKAEDQPQSTALKRASWAEITIDVLDVNIHSPKLVVEQQIENITENNDVGITVGILNCTDMDWNDTLDVTLRGGSQGYFKLSKFGDTFYRVTVMKNIDREKITSLTLQVQCSDGAHNDSQTLRFIVLDQNDNAPKFTNSDHHVPVQENVNTTYSQLKAADHDVGKNGAISYSLIISDHWKNKITIDSSTGLIQIGSLDREAIDHDIDFIVTAVDQGDPALTGTVKVTLNITDENDNPPQYKDCDKTRSVWLEEGKIYNNFSSKAFDVDSHTNAEILYRYGTNTGLFQNAIHVSSNGLITFDLTNVDADGQRSNIYNITIEAYNTVPYSDPNIKNATQTFHLHVIDVNDNNPEFVNKTYHFTFNETLTKGSFIGRVEATDKDLSEKYNTVTYSMQELLGTFRIDKCTGDLYLDRIIDLDVEKNSTFTFKVYASDGGLSSPHGRQGQATVTITVLAVNDNPPEFTQDFSTCQLPENHSGKFNCSVKAVDLDNDQIKYEIVDSQMDFAVGMSTGEITSTRGLDYDRTVEHFFVLNISVFDGVHTVYTMKTVQLVNLNDEKPTFDGEEYIFQVKENNPKDMLIGHVNVTDRDCDNIVLSIGNTQDFHITNVGELHTRISFDSDVRDFYSFGISASDGQNTANATIYVHIVDVNDNVPEFDANVYNTILSINESQSTSKTILTVRATDDDNEVPNSNISYRLQSGNHGDIFMLDSSSGELSLNSTVNASLYQQFELLIIATDGGTPALSNITTITINIQDENNNAPIFLYEPYEGSVRENFNGSILKVEAMDPDLNDTLQFKVTEKCRTTYNVSFRANILSADYIDAESVGNNLIIVCGITVTDGIHSVNSSVKIKVIDENDNKPVITMSEDYIEINDTSLADSHILDINATDRDVSTRTEKIFFYLDENSPYLSFFHLDYITGKLSVQSSLKQISGSTIKITVTARDAGSPPLKSSKNITIVVKEVNVNPPRFTSSPIKLNVSENAAGFSEKIKATDHDGDIVSYRIVSGNVDDIFILDQTTGTLSLSNSSFTFDYETKSHYSLVVEATDNAHFSKSASVTVEIKVVDVNEAPRVQVAAPVVYRQINTTANNIITSVIVEDPDTDPQFRQCTFNISSKRKHGGSFFKIKGNGTITTARILTEPGIFPLTVCVTNVQIGHCLNITVFVVDVQRISKSYNLNENTLVPEILDHFGGDYSYTILPPVIASFPGLVNFTLEKNGSYFDLVAWTLYDFESMSDPHIHFSMEGIDHVSNLLGKLIQVDITVVNINDNPPVYNSSHFEFSIYENVTKGECIGTVTATDADGVLTNLRYSINGPDLFNINRSNGCLSLTKTWDFDNSKHHIETFKVTCNDTKFTDEAMITVTVMDVNDNSPCFSNSSYEFNLHESKPVGVTIYNMSATDKDLLDKGKLFYELKGSDSHYFNLDPHTGIFSLARNVDYEDRNLLEFTVTVFDTAGHMDSATVKVNVLDDNDNSPRFGQPSYSFKVLEGLSYKGQNFTITATDNDTDLNGQITFELRQPHYPAFSLSQRGDMGFLHVVQQLDRENPNVPHENGSAIYTVTAIAKDHGNPARTSSAMIYVHVEDINDCPPKFSQKKYNVSVQEGVDIGQHLISVTTTDCDYDPVYTRASFSLVSDGHAFQITNEGELLARIPFDYEVKDFYPVTVSATDGQNTANATIDVHILDVNDNAPEFDANVYNTILSINESQPADKMILTITARDNDKDAPNNMVSYRLQYGNHGDMFMLNTSSGELSLKTSVNASVYQQFELVIIATDGGTPALSNVTTVTIKVIDENNHVPIFLFEPYEGIVRENYRGPILKVEAMDPDLNNTLHYEVTEKSRTTCNVSFKENILFANYIDAESIGDNLTVICGITVTDGVHSVNSSVKIKVIDENDNKPVITISEDYIEINDTSLADSHILDINAVDRDVSTRTEKIFFYLDENSPYLSFFHLDYITGKLSVQSSLKQISGSTIKITVTARDAGSPPLKSSKNITIVVKEVNVNPPRFTSSPIKLNVSENAAGFSEKIKATDNDGDIVSYRIVSGNVDDIFILNQTTGTLTLSNSSFTFDYETNSKYSFVVEATDNAHFPKSTSVSVVIEVLDVNEAPRVSIVSPVVYRQINTAANNIVTSVIVEDPDSDPQFRLCTFNISSKHDHGRSFFKIEGNGTITTARILTEPGSFLLTVCVTNVQIENCSNFSVIVIDVQHISRSYDLLENTSVPKILGQFRGDYTYTIIPPVVTSFPGRINFTLEKNGTYFDLVTWTQYDYEKMADPNIHISIDGINNTVNLLEMQIQINIRVININDNSPVFNATHFDFIMYENATKGHRVGTVTANDADGTLTSLTYTRSGTGSFTVDRSNGDICLENAIDFDSSKVHHHTFKITCNDTKFTDEATVTVTVLDVNDNPPCFSNSTYLFKISESMPVDVILYDMQVLATDKDVLDEGKLTYVLEGSDSQYFELDPRSGVFTLNKQLDYEDKNILEFGVRVSDTAGHMDNATVKVKILDYNDHSPRFSRSSYNFTVLEGSTYEGQNFAIEATDNDTDVNGQFTLELHQPHDLAFSLSQDGNTGFLHIVKPLDRENSEVPHINGTAIYTVRAVARDHGDPARSSSVAIHVFVEDVNDCPPEFSQKYYNVSVKEGLDIGQHLITVSTTDCDYDPAYTRTNFSFVNGGRDFSITNDGELLAEIPFDYEVKDYYRINISAADGHSTTCAGVHVHILDLNDNAPQFDPNIYNTILSINESQPAGKIILRVKATDNDKDAPNNEVSYMLQYGNHGDIFMLNTSTGELSLQSTVNASVYQQFELVIIATDGGTPALSNITTVTINIVDENNNAPIFLYEPFEGSVRENYKGSILKVYAADPDLNDTLYFQVEDACQTTYNISFKENILFADYIDAESIGDNLTIVCGITVTDAIHSVNSSVKIKVIDENDNKPVIMMSEDYIEINDTSQVGSHILDINATDRDISTRTEKIFFYLDENFPYLSHFHLDYETGALSVQRSLKQISRSTINMTVMARDAGSPPLKSSKNITIVVKEVNEHSPEFTSSPINLNISENKAGFSAVIKAIDLDGDIVSYKIVSGNVDDIFFFNQTTGNLTLSNSSFEFDYETNSKYSLVIEATDNANFPKSASVTVEIEVLDVNEAPRVHVAAPVVYRKINTTANNIITSVIVEDPDSETDFRQCNFSISSQYENGSLSLTRDLFAIDKNGTIRTEKPLTYAGTFLLTVHVINIKIEQSLNLTVIVSNVEGISKSYDLLENTSVPEILDQFCGNYTYTILSPVITSFLGMVNFTLEKNGTCYDLVTWTQFDFERMTDPSIQFSIEGINQLTNLLEKQIQIDITVININDNPPVFYPTHFDFNMYENATKGECIGTVTAQDADGPDGPLTSLTYSKNGSGTFSIDPVNGSVYLSDPLDFDTTENHQYTFTVTCNDTRFAASATVEVTLLDINDNPPRFTTPKYHFNISESLPVGVPIHNMTVLAIDKDSLDEEQLSYRLEGNDSQYFTLDQHTGMFTLAQGLDYEEKRSLECVVIVSDTAGQMDNATVLVNILDVNDQAPRFSQSSYNFTVLEGLLYEGQNFTIIATDKDTDLNGQITLELRQPHDPAFNLSQNGTVGFLHIVKPLDRENPEVPHINGTAIYTVTAVARDNGDPALSSSALIHVYVADMNDCPPEFSQTNYNVSVQEGVDIGQHLITVTTTDCDYDPAYTRTNFTLGGNGHESFKLHSIGDNNAEIVVAQKLSRTTKPLYNLIINATDGRNERSASLRVTILDTNDHSPSFNPETYNFNVTEEKPRGLLVGTVTASDVDVGQNGNVTYRITGGNSNNTFQIITNYSSGVGEIKTNSRLDREHQSIYRMIITAEDGAKIGKREGTCSVTVTVMDINDNYPVFNTLRGYTGTVMENSNDLTIVQINPVIKAEDADYGTNGTYGIRYYLVNDTYSDSFHIDEVTGQVTISGPVDRESTPVLHFTVIAEDSDGDVAARKAKMNLTINVLDENDCPPEFLNNSYVFSIPENCDSHTSVGQVSVTDDDVSGIDNVQFRIIHGDDEKFYMETVHGTGIIRVGGNIDREIKDIYILTVVANDGRNEGNTTVTIIVKDMNDNAPVFSVSSLTVVVQENLPVPTRVCTVTATDNDQRNTPNSLVTYYLDDQSSTKFNITENGEIFAIASLDRETQATYKIFVIAKDNGSSRINSSMEIVILVGDENDNSPHFFDETGKKVTEKEVNIVEKSPVDSVVALILAKDLDYGANGTIELSVETSDITKYFKIEQLDNSTAVVKIAQSISINTLIYTNMVPKNSSESVTLDLGIIASDNGERNTTKSSNMTLVVNIETINDATPVFLKPDQPLYVMENSAIGTTVGKCEAVVVNTTLTHLTYLLVDNRTENEFRVNPENCTIVIASDLDREKEDIYNFPVMVKDGRTPERTAFTMIQVIVKDDNDNVPVFHRPVIHLDLRENMNYTQPINVSAVDRDLENNAVLTYSLLNTYDGNFTIQNETGLLSVVQPLDYESYTNYTITVVAKDNGTPPLNATSTLYVTVIDINDNDPEFYYVNNTLHVQENYIGEISTIFANDSDSGLNGKVLFRISSSCDGCFAIDPLNGTLSVIKALDYEKQRSHTIEITATDLGDPPRTSTVNITVDVEDVKDFVLSFEKNIYTANISRNVQQGDIVVRVNASLPAVHYAMSGSDTDYFWIDKVTGAIHVSQPLEDQRDRYILTVTATTVVEPDTASCMVIVTVTDHLILFPHEEYHVNLTENVKSEFLFDLNTTEEINLHEVSYEIVRTEPPAPNKFSIDDKGRIRSLEAVDHENSSVYILYITAAPRNKRQRRSVENYDGSTTLVQIVVHVTDVNDNPPVFPATQKRQFGVPHEARAGYLVTTIKAEDKDSPEEGKDQILYKFVNNDNSDKKIFSIQQNSGKLFVRTALSSLTRTEFNFTILAYDPLDINKNDTINIQIRVIENSERLLLVTPIAVDEFRRRQEELIRNMSMVLGIGIEVEYVEAHKEIQNGSVRVSLDSTDLFFHGINKSTGLPLSNDAIIGLIGMHRHFLESLFGQFKVTPMKAIKHLDSSAMGVPEIALISLAVFIFIGSVVAIVLACFTLKSDHATFQDRKDSNQVNLDDFELQPVSSDTSTPVANGFVNPAFKQEASNKSDKESVNDKHVPGQALETQEIHVEFDDEQIDQNLPEATVKENGVIFPSQGAKDIDDVSLSSNIPGPNGSVTQIVTETSLSEVCQLRPDDGPVMTSSPKVVRFKDTNVSNMKDTGERPEMPENTDKEDKENDKTPEILEESSAFVTFDNVTGETETDDAVEKDGGNTDCIYADMVDITDNTPIDLNDAVPKSDKGSKTLDPLDSDIEEVTCF